MKNDLNEAMSLIQQSIRACGQDFATTGVRSHLLAALREAGHVSKKRKRRQTPMDEMATRAKSLNSEWWEKIQEGVRNAAKKEFEKQDTGSELQEPQ